MTPANPNARGLLVDVVRCTGCRECVKACKQAHDFPGDPKTTTELSATAYTALVERPDGVNLRNLCRHCLNPACASVCPVAALRKTDLGPVTYEESRCIGCRYCMVACPFSIPRYEWDKAVPAVRKCDMCYDRQCEGKKTACTEACTYEATVGGTREELLKEAHARIADMPDEYEDHVYGETEVGGTSVLFLLPKNQGSLFPANLGTEALPAHTWQVLKKIPAIAVSGGAAMLAFWWITRRRDEVAQWETARAQEGHAGSKTNRKEA